MSEWVDINERLPDVRSIRSIYEIDDKKGRYHLIQGPRTYLAWTRIGLELWRGGYAVYHDKNGDHFLTAENANKAFSPDFTKREMRDLIKLHSIQYWMEIPLPPGWTEGEPPKEEDHDNV